MSQRFWILAIGAFLLVLSCIAIYNVTRPGLGDSMFQIEVPLPPIVMEETDQLMTVSGAVSADVLRASYEPLTPFAFGTQSMYASIADTDELRTKGLSNTSSLPPDIAKVFVFAKSAKYGFWMKDMNYAIDIFWLNDEGDVIHIAPNVSPTTYPTTFTPPSSARYVIETNTGFAYKNNIQIGDTVELTQILEAR